MNEEELSSVCHLEDIIGTIGQWLDMEFDDSVPVEAQEYLWKAYEACVKGCEE